MIENATISFTENTKKHSLFVDIPRTNTQLVAFKYKNNNWFCKLQNKTNNEHTTIWKSIPSDILELLIKDIYKTPTSFKISTQKIIIQKLNKTRKKIEYHYSTLN